VCRKCRRGLPAGVTCLSGAKKQAKNKAKKVKVILRGVSTASSFVRHCDNIQLPFISPDVMLTIGLPYNEPNLSFVDFADIPRVERCRLFYDHSCRTVGKVPLKDARADAILDRKLFRSGLEGERLLGGGMGCFTEVGIARAV